MLDTIPSFLLSRLQNNATRTSEENWRKAREKCWGEWEKKSFVSPTDRRSPSFIMLMRPNERKAPNASHHYPVKQPENRMSDARQKLLSLFVPFFHLKEPLSNWLGRLSQFEMDMWGPKRATEYVPIKMCRRTKGRKAAVMSARE